MKKRLVSVTRGAALLLALLAAAPVPASAEGPQSPSPAASPTPNPSPSPAPAGDAPSVKVGTVIYANYTYTDEPTTRDADVGMAAAGEHR